MLYLFLELTLEQIASKIKFNQKMIKKLQKKARENTELYLLTGESVYLDRVCKCDELIAELKEELETLNN